MAGPLKMLIECPKFPKAGDIPNWEETLFKVCPLGKLLIPKLELAFELLISHH